MPKSFDKVWHKGLIYKLKNHVSGDFLRFLKSFWSNRKQGVDLNDNVQIDKALKRVALKVQL